jgi:uncharacterized protein (DUF2235 family)
VNTLSVNGIAVMLLSVTKPRSKAMKRILVCLDGTNNSPDDTSITNVLKLHFFAGGKLDNSSDDPNLLSLYYEGVGNRDITKIGRSASAMFAVFEPKEILQAAYDDLAENYQPGDELFIFGFSRGAAIARKLAQLINDQGIKKQDEKDSISVADPGVRIRFLGVWDTVAAFGGANLNKDKLPTSGEVDEKEGRIAANVQEACHLVSIDDPRLAFRPVLMGHEKRVQEVWFAGVHSDVGGGYDEDGLSDVTLDFMMRKVEAAGVTFKQLDSIDIPADAKLKRDHVKIVADPMDELHLQAVKDAKTYADWIESLKDIMEPRKIYVAKKDQPTNILPLIHHTTIERKKNKQDYNSPSLNSLRGAYRVLNADGTIREPES